jgi:RNA polymerase sigma-70 factor (ECF subfamily)
MDTTKTNQLLRRIVVDNDTRAFSELYEAMHKSLYRFAVTLTRSREPAEEITADVFIRLWQRRQSIAPDNIRNCRLYLFMCIKNACLNHIRDHRHMESLNLDQLSLESWKTEVSPEELLITAEIAGQLNKAIDELPPKCGLIFRLVKEEELSYKEAAQLLDVSTKTVENQIGIALKKIRTALPYKIPTRSWG